MLFLLLAVQLDVCKLLDAKTIAAVQGAPPASVKATDHKLGELLAQQCFYALPDVSRSVSLEVTTGPQAALAERWETVRGEKKEAGEEEEGANPPKPVKGVGRGAVWSGNEKAGALYVRAPQAIVRVSVGGPANEAAKIAASTKLSKAALKSLARRR